MLKMRARSRTIKKSVESQKVLEALDNYLESNLDEPMKWLVRFWKDQAAVMLYKDLREIVIGEADPQSLFDQWFSDYSVFLSSKMTASWESAYFAAWNSTAEFVGLEEKISSEIYVRDWIINRTGNLITNVCSDQVNAVRYLIAEAQSLGMGSDETARYIRPTVGLTERQAAANLRHYNSVKTQLRADHPRMKEESIERKARTAAAKYAERQQRYRAETIARTEIAQAYNAGADAFIREAIRHDLMPEMKKEWSTALDERVCKECQALEGVQISMDDSFETQSGRRNVNWASGTATNIRKNLATPDETDLQMVMKAHKNLTDIIEKSNEDNEKGELEDMLKINKSKMTAEERTAYDELIKKYAVETEEQTEEPVRKSAPKAEDPDIVDDSEVTKTQKSVTPPPAAPTTETSADTGDDIYKGLHPAVRARLEALEKRAAEAEERELLDVAKKYEIVGEKPEELVKTLKSLKDAGGTAYNDMISVLDRSVDMVEKSGVFSEIGKSFSGNPVASIKKSAAESKIDTIAKGYMEKDSALTYNAALAKAWEDHPELLDEYEAEAGY